MVAPRESACGGLDLAGALANVLVLEEEPSAPPSAELLSVPVGWDPRSFRGRGLKGYSVGPAITHGGKAYSVQWDLLKSSHVAAVVGALDLLRPRLLAVTLLGLYQFVVDRAVERREYLAVCFTAEDGEWKPWAFEGWRRCFGTLSEPRFCGGSLELTTASSQERLAGVVLWLRSPASGYRISASPRPVSGAESPMLWATFPTTMGKARLLTTTFRARTLV